MQIQPYLFFDGRCEEAITFYRKALGAEVEMMLRYREGPGTPPPGPMHPNFGDKVMHASVRIGSDSVMMSDDCMGHPRFDGFSLSLAAKDATEARRRFDALANGGKVTMPLAQTFFSPCFGMVSDRFGVRWMIMVPAEPA